MSDGDRHVGNDFLIYIDSNTAIAGNDSLDYEVSGSAIDLSSKDTGGWAINKPGRRSWSFSASGKFVEGDTGRQGIKSAVATGQTVNIVIERPDGTSVSGEAVITSYNESGPDEGAFTYSISGTGTGELSDDEISSGS